MMIYISFWRKKNGNEQHNAKVRHAEFLKNLIGFLFLVSITVSKVENVNNYQNMTHWVILNQPIAPTLDYRENETIKKIDKNKSYADNFAKCLGLVFGMDCQWNRYSCPVSQRFDIAKIIQTDEDKG